MSYWPEDESGSHWQGHYEGEAQEHATNGDYKHGNGNGYYENGGYENGGYENGGGGGYYENGYGGLRGRRGGRGSKRWARTLAFLQSLFAVGGGPACKQWWGCAVHGRVPRATAGPEACP